MAYALTREPVPRFLGPSATRGTAWRFSLQRPLRFSLAALPPTGPLRPQRTYRFPGLTLEGRPGSSPPSQRAKKSRRSAAHSDASMRTAQDLDPFCPRLPKVVRIAAATAGLYHT